MRRVLGICGRRRSGKNTLARKLTLYFPDLEIVSLAAPLKGIGVINCGNLLALTPHVTPEARKLLTDVGGALFQTHPHKEFVYVNLLQAYIDTLPEHKKVVVTDVRMEHEVSWVRENNGVVVKIIGGGGDDPTLDSHVTETQVDKVSADLVLASEDVMCSAPDTFLERVILPIQQITGWETLAQPRKPAIFVALNIQGRATDDYKTLGNHIADILESAGFDVLLPLYDEFDDRYAWVKSLKNKDMLTASTELFHNNVKKIQESDSVLAYISAPSLGIGIELLTAFLLGKPIVVCVLDETLLYHPYLWVMSHGNLCSTLQRAVTILSELWNI